MHESRETRAIFATLSTNVMYKGHKFRDTVPNGTQNGDKGATGGPASLGSYCYPPGGTGIEKSEVQAAFTMVSVGYLVATMSWADIISR